MLNIIQNNIIRDPRWKVRTETTWCVVHHAKALNCTIQDIDSWHRQKGWLGAGYHIFIDKLGKIYEGRSIEVEGAHTAGYNHESIGICLEGNFEIENLEVFQKLALIDALNYIIEKYPNIKIVPHSELYNTLCPGSGVMNHFSDILSKVQVKKVAEKNYVLREEFNKLVEDFNKLQNSHDRLLKVLKQRNIIAKDLIKK